MTEQILDKKKYYSCGENNYPYTINVPIEQILNALKQNGEYITRIHKCSITNEMINIAALTSAIPFNYTFLYSPATYLTTEICMVAIAKSDIALLLLLNLLMIRTKPKTLNLEFVIHAAIMRNGYSLRYIKPSHHKYLNYEICFIGISTAKTSADNINNEFNILCLTQYIPKKYINLNMLIHIIECYLCELNSMNKFVFRHFIYNSIKAISNIISRQCRNNSLIVTKYNNIKILYKNIK
jgi:hypothetical protein